MTKKASPNKIEDMKKVDNTPMFVSWAGENGTDKLPNSFASAQPIFRATADFGYDYESRNPNVTTRDAYRSTRYNVGNINQITSTEAKDIIRASMWAYKHIGIINRTVDLMADFACDGIEIVHPDQKIQTFLQNWAKTVGFKHVSERFMNYLYRTGNVIVQKVHSKLRQKDVDLLQKTSADVVPILESDVPFEPPVKAPRNQIPYAYSFKNPLTVEVLGGEDVALFTGVISHGIRVPTHLAEKIRNPKTIENKMLINTLPKYMVDIISQGSNIIPLDPEKISVYHYKKDDWEIWAQPMTACILDDLTMLNKLKMADSAALDGAISHVRLWKLGSLEHKLYPTEAAVARLSDMLAAAVGGGAIDIIWGPELTFEETGTEIYKFLGTEKYGATIVAIYDGLGLPTAIGAFAGVGTNLQNNSISVKVLIQRLQYGRSILVGFWEEELRSICDAFKFRKPASIRFGKMNLTDETAEKALLIQLCDRNLISIETVQERFGEIPELEQLRQNKEARQQKSGKRLRKASQWHNAEYKESLTKIALQTGVITPGQAGAELAEDKPLPGEVSPLKLKQQAQKALQANPTSTLPANTNLNSDQSGQPGQGRPINSKDKKKRKDKQNTAQTGKSVAAITTAFAWARNSQEVISNVVNPWFLKSLDKKNLRQISDEETKNLEKFKYTLLCNCSLYSVLDDGAIAKLVNSGPLMIPDKVEHLCAKTISQFTEKFNREPTLDETRQIQASVYALYQGDIDNG